MQTYKGLYNISRLQLTTVTYKKTTPDERKKEEKKRRRFYFLRILVAGNGGSVVTFDSCLKRIEDSLVQLGSSVHKAIMYVTAEVFVFFFFFLSQEQRCLRWQPTRKTVDKMASGNVRWKWTTNGSDRTICNSQVRPGFQPCAKEPDWQLHIGRLPTVLSIDKRSCRETIR